MTVFANLFFIILLINFIFICQVFIKKNFLLSAPLGYSLFIAIESIVLNFYSIFHLVNFYSIIITNVLIVALTIYWLYKKKLILFFIKSLKYSFLDLFNSNIFWLTIPLWILIIYGCVFYLPHTWDSMTYHLSRVVHWIQNNSIDYYNTNIKRQILFPPGAEYLVLMLQIISGNDYLASLVQFFALFTIFISFPSILKLLSVPSKWSKCSYLFLVGAPMIVLEASSTFTDIVAALNTVSVFICLLIIYKRKHRNNYSDFAFLAISLGSAFLTKPTAIMVVVPFILSQLFIITVRLLKGQYRIFFLFKNALISLILFCLIAGPDIYRRNHELGSDWSVLSKKHGIGGVYSNDETTSIRLQNMKENLSFHLPEIVNKETLNINHNTEVYSTHEAFAGNYAICLILLLSIFSMCFFIWYIKKENTIIILLFLLGWCVLHWYVPWMPWNSRLQICFFVFSPLVLLLVPFKHTNKFVIFIKFIYLSILSILLIYGLLTSLNSLINNQSRPLKLDRTIEHNFKDYFIQNPGLYEKYYRALKYLVNNKVDTVGLMLSEDDYEYPLIWELHKKGVFVEHINYFDTLKYHFVFSTKKIPYTNWTEVSEDLFVSPDKNQRTIKIGYFIVENLYGAIPYKEISKELNFKIKEGDFIEVTIKSHETITEKMKVEFIMYDKPNWENTLVFHNQLSISLFGQR